MVTLSLKEALVAAQQALAERPPLCVLSEHPTSTGTLLVSSWRAELSNFNRDPWTPNLILLLTANAEQHNIKDKTEGDVYF